MPTYCFRCPECETTGETRRPPEDYYKPFKCPNCRTEMVRDFRAEKVNSGNRDYSRPIISDSLAINPEQIPEHKRLFPDIEVTSQGQPVLDNYKKHDNYLKKCGFVKPPKRNRRKFAKKIGGRKNSKTKTKAKIKG